MQVSRPFVYASVIMHPQAGSDKEKSVQKLLWLVGATIGSSIGWWLGAKFGMMTAFLVSMVGTVLGIFLGFKLAKSLIE